MTEIRTAKPEDAGRLLEIYDYYVTSTAVSLEYETPSLEEFTARMERTLKAGRPMPGPVKSASTLITAP